MKRPPTVPSLLKRLEATWKRFDGLERSLAKGATQKQIARFLKRLGRRPPEDLLVVLAWHDGSRGREIDGYYNLLSLEGILHMKKILDDMLPDFDTMGWMPGEWWNADWLPFLEFNGDHLCIDLTGSAGKPPGQVLSFRCYGDARPLLHRSFRDWLRTLTTLWEKTPTGTSEDDRTEWFVGKGAERLRWSLNPGYPIRRRARKQPAPRPPKNLELFRETFNRGPYEWRIQRAGALVQTLWGRAYSRSRKDKSFNSIEEASTFVERQIRTKLREGYVKAPSPDKPKDDEFLVAAGRHLAKLGKKDRS